MIGNTLKRIFMIDKSNCVTFELIKLGFSGSDQMPLNTLGWGTAPRRQISWLPKLNLRASAVAASTEAGEGSGA